MFDVLTFSKTILLSGTLNEVKEMKGLDIVRRDWCDLAKDAGKYVLYQLLCKLKNVFIERTNEELTNDLTVTNGRINEWTYKQANANEWTRKRANEWTEERTNE